MNLLRALASHFVGLLVGIVLGAFAVGAANVILRGHSASDRSLVGIGVAALSFIVLRLLFEVRWSMHFRYLSYVARHKYFVFREGIKLKVPIWRLIVHDWTKFLPVEWYPYTTWFYGAWRKDGVVGEDKASSQDKAAYDRAWLHHQKHNDHHWQWWLLSMDGGQVVPLEMSDAATREMLADWRGAGRALGKPDTLAWYTENRAKININPKNRAWIEAELGYKA